MMRQGMNFNSKKEFQYTCISPKSDVELDFILENEEEISFKEFSEAVDINYVKQHNKARGFDIFKDFAVSFHVSSTQDGKKVYFFKDSAIEHIFY